jgi:hypothetical protein
MKKIVFLFIFSLVSIAVLYGKTVKEYTCFEISGFEITLIPSDIYRIENNTSVEFEEIVNGDTLSITILDQRGTMPKGKLIIYFNKIDYISVHNSLINTSGTYIPDSINIYMAASFGSIGVKSQSLSVDLSAGSNLTILGETDILNATIGAGAFLNAEKLLSQDANVEIIGHSNAIINSKHVEKGEVAKGSKLQNVYKGCVN